MKKIKCLLILLFLMPVFVYAEESFCNYELVGKQKSVSAKLNKETGEFLFDFYYNIFNKEDYNAKFTNITACPTYVYKHKCTFMGTIYQYSLNQNENSCTVFETYKFYSTDNDPESHIIKPGDKYDNVEKCKDTTYEFIAGCGCMPSSLTDLTSRLYFLLKIIAPALLLIVGGFDMIKAVTAQDEKAIKKAQQKLVNKFVAAAAIFLTFTVVQLLVSLLSKDAEGTLVCLKYILEGYNG